MTNGMRRTVTEKQQNALDRINRQIARRSAMHRMKRRMLLPFRRLMKAREIVWTDGYGGSYPACPKCGEYVYYRDLCCFCGQRLKEGITVGQILDRDADG